MALIREACHENGAALLLVSHDREVLGQFEDTQEFERINQSSPEEARV
jgi:putative ABC transport system ATP-binding protein